MTKLWPRDSIQDDARAFFRLRIAFGSLGLLLPLLLAAAGLVADGQVQPSISDFFHTTQRDLLVGGLCAIGVFLASHRGLKKYPGRWLSPDVIAIVAGTAAIGVAFFPNESETISTFSQRTLGLDLSPAFHYASASMLYLAMSLTCFLAYAPDADGWERQAYRVAGAIIWVTGWNVMILSGIKNNFDTPLAQAIQAHNLIYWDESIGVWAFSAAWILKAIREQRSARDRAFALLRRRDATLQVAPAEAPIGQGPGGTTLRGLLQNRLRGLRNSAATRRLAFGATSSADVAPAHQVTLHRHRRTAPRTAQARQATPGRRKAS